MADEQWFRDETPSDWELEALRYANRELNAALEKI